METAGKGATPAAFPSLHTDTLRIVLLGKTGAGKSTLGNVLTGLQPVKATAQDKRDEAPPEQGTDPNIGFKEGRGLRSQTVFSDWKTAIRRKTVLEVTDTPGLSDTHLPEHLIHKEVAKSVALLEPGANVIAFVLRCDRKFTNEEFDAYVKIKQLLSDDISKYLILVFTGMDVHSDDGVSIEDQRRTLCTEVENFGDRLSDMVKEAGGRFFGMNNKASAADKERQAFDLIDMMEALVRRNGQNTYFQNELTEKIREEVIKEAEKNATLRKVSPDQARVDLKRDIASEKVSPGLWAAITSLVAASARRVTDGVKDMCSVM